MKKFKIRPATNADYREVYGHDVAVSVRAWAIEVEGELAGISGVQLGPYLIIAFAKQKDGFKASKRLIWEVSQAMMELFKAAGWRSIVAIAEPDRCLKASKFLERLGFQWADSSPIGEVFICRH